LKPIEPRPIPCRAVVLPVARSLAAALIMALGCGAGDSTPTGPATPPTPSPPSAAGLVLASGELLLPGAGNESDSGNHEVLVVRHQLRSDLEGTSGQLLVLSLQDLSRPAQSCPSEEPEEGCATIDWSADPEDPRVPPGGQFVNRLDFELTSGSRRVYLSRSFHLNDVPDRVDPLREHTAVGGTASEWQLVLPAALEPDTPIELRVVMTKWQPPNVRIGYEIRLAEDN
jgi:hypothetical protein